MFKFLDFFRNSRSAERGGADDSVFHRKYASFKRLLLSNNRALEIIADLENTIYQDQPFTYMYAVSQTESLVVEVNSIAQDLNALSGNTLFRAAARRPAHLRKDPLRTALQTAASRRRASCCRWSGSASKTPRRWAARRPTSARSTTGPICRCPRGSPLPPIGYQLFLDYNELTELIQKKLKDLDINDTDALMAVSQELQNRIVDADLPADLRASILQAAQDLKAHRPHDFKLSVRSSATSEDSEASFAGQHATVLNVSEANLIEAYKDVVASTFSPRAIYYRRRRGYRDQDVNMSVACIVMIHAEVSGVMYTVDPNDSRHAVIMISAVWGLAADAVEGAVATDFFQVHKQTMALETSEIALKERRLRPDPAGGVLEEDLPEDLKRAACLTGEQIRLLADYAVRLENHYGYALDIEWVIDPQGKLYILQARPLKRSQRFGAEAVGAADARPPRPRPSRSR